MHTILKIRDRGQKFKLPAVRFKKKSLSAVSGCAELELMATTVNVLCPNGRRVNVKATPATALLQVCGHPTTLRRNLIEYSFWSRFLSRHARSRSLIQLSTLSSKMNFMQLLLKYSGDIARWAVLTALGENCSLAVLSSNSCMYTTLVNVRDVHESNIHTRDKCVLCIVIPLYTGTTTRLSI